MATAMGFVHMAGANRRAAGGTDMAMKSMTTKRVAWLVLVVAAGLSLGGCGSDPVDECQSDSDCKGDRVCEGGECVSPSNGEGEGEGEGPVCGNGVCESGETDSCADCQSGDPYAKLAVNNTTSLTVWRLFVASCSSESWGPDQLGGNIIFGGNVFTLTQITPDCYDFRAETESGETYWQRASTYLDAGETFTWTLIP